MGAAMLLPAWKAALPQQSRVGLGTWQTFDALDAILPLFVQLGGSVGHRPSESSKMTDGSRYDRAGRVIVNSNIRRSPDG